MCIALLSTAHPAYPLILLSNRDEFLNRPTAPASWWDLPNQHVLGGRDLERAERGTWLGITKQGRLAVLTNFREEGAEKARAKSRGGIINAYLTAPLENHESGQDFARRLIEEVGVSDVGGFSLLFGELKAAGADGSFPGLSILSNRSESAAEMPHIATKPGETHGLSNSHFGDRSWPKVVNGEELLKQIIDYEVHRGTGEEELIENLFSILTIDTLPRKKEGEDWETYVVQMRNSIMIPPVGGPAVENKAADKVATGSGDAGVSRTTNHVQVGTPQYGTQKQTVVLVDKDGRVVFAERTLYDKDMQRLEGEDAEKRYEFTIEEWNQ